MAELIRSPRVAIIGAGMAGILCAIRLQALGLSDFMVYEKAGRVGGTWRDNAYPGIACDVPSHAYRYSFEPNPDWSRCFAPGPEILSYFERVVRKYGLDRFLRLGVEITRCSFESGRWKLFSGDGELDTVDFIIAATGVLHHPARPDIEGLDTFAGTLLHSARWDHSVGYDGIKFGIIGAGSSATQIVPAVVDRVAHLTMFQRTPQWIMHVDNPEFSEAEKSEFRRDPDRMELLRTDWLRRFTDRFSDTVIDAESPAMRDLEDFCRGNLEKKVRDPVLREKLRPDYRAGCKRLVASPDFYEAIQRKNAELVSEPIVRVEPQGIRTKDGRLHELDVLVLATGFKVDQFMRPMEIVGRDRKALSQVWEKRPFAYLSISIPDFPNFFMLNGPNGPVGNISLIEVAERQMEYILQLIGRWRSGGCNEISATTGATLRFNAERDEQAKRTVWYTGCRSWYLDDRGIPMVWPFSFDRFVSEMKQPRLADYEERA